MPDSCLVRQRLHTAAVRFQPEKLCIFVAALCLAEYQAAAVAEPSDKANVVVIVGKLPRLSVGEINNPDLRRPGSIGQIGEALAVRRERRAARGFDIQVLLNGVWLTKCRNGKKDDDR